MSSRFDVIIVGLGAMGSAVACHLARRGKRILGLDRFAPPHAFGSSHGQTRIIREAYFEHPLYVPLVQRADLRTDEPAVSWEGEGGGVRVVTSKGAYQANQLVLTAGSWIQSLLRDLQLPLVVERQVQFWFEPKHPLQFQPERCPIHVWEHERGRFFYGFPDLGGGVKVARHHEGERVNPDSINLFAEVVGCTTHPALLCSI